MNKGTTKRPNVLVILVDQLRYDVFSHRGNRVIETPKLDRLAGEGVLLTDATCSTPLCGPSRACLLSGCYGFDGKYQYRNCETTEKGLWLGEITTVDEALAEAGYHVEYHGKWHTGREHLDCYKGGRRVFGHKLVDYDEHLAARYPRPPDDGEHKIDRYTGWPYRYWPVDDMMEAAARNGFQMPHHNEAGIIDVADEDTLTAWTASKTTRFLGSRPQTPFAVTCSILQPHAPLIANEKYATMFDPADMPMPRNVDHTIEKNPPIPGALPADASGLGQFMALYYGLVKELDDWVGKMLDALDSAGLAQDTLVIFTSDHGELMGSHRTLSKMRFFEESLRVPLIMRYPRAIAPGAKRDAAASGADVAPTVLDYCGVPALPQFHGRSLRGVIDGEPPADEFAYSDTRVAQCLRSREWKYVTKLDEPPQLYELGNDPYEMHNLLAERPVSREAISLKEELDHRLAAEFPKRWLSAEENRR